MKLRESSKVKPRTRTYPGISELDDNSVTGNESGGETWQPSMDGFVKYLVDSKLVFNFIERVVDESSDVSCEFFLHYLLLSFYGFFGFLVCSFISCCTRISWNLIKVNVYV